MAQLANAVVSTGDPVFWDENSGPSQASESSVGTIPSEAFTINTSGGEGGTTPEPSSIMLFGSGILGLAGVLRRKFPRSLNPSEVRKPGAFVSGFSLDPELTDTVLKYPNSTC